jgi:hypothetical protein
VAEAGGFGLASGGVGDRVIFQQFPSFSVESSVYSLRVTYLCLNYFGQVV